MCGQFLGTKNQPDPFSDTDISLYFVIYRAIQFSQAVVIQLIQFIISRDFVLHTVTCQNSSM